MELRPADLGMERNVALIFQRAQAYANAQSGRRAHRVGFAHGIAAGGGAGAAAMAGGGKPLGTLGRIWARMAGMDEETARAVLTGTGQMTNGFVGGFVGGSLGMIIPGLMMTILGGTGAGDPPLVMGPMFLAMGLGFSSIGIVAPGKMLKRWHQTPLLPGEVEGLLADTDTSDTLERSYLMLLRDALSQANLSPEAETDLRAAIRSLGQAIDRMPPLTTGMRVDAEALREDALSAQAEAAAEPDPVIAASKERRAEALERSAKAAAQSALLLRRTAALREELAAQTEALRLGLAAFYSGGGDAHDLSHLAESVRAVAAEATSVADARAELDAPPSAATRAADYAAAAAANAAAAAQPQQVGRGLS
ncbi:MAG TPA: hypothetical protein VM490_06040 [Armatimonadaceae bacterium]|nr:hypothetical protein [Armatimonadaceae bacterium]